MNNRTLLVIALAALIALLAAFAINQSRKPADAISQDAKLLVPELKDHINDVNKVVLTAAESKPLVIIERGKDGWTVANKGAYPADVAKLRKFLLAMSEAKLIEPKTRASQKYAELGVDDVSVKDAKGLQVELDGLAKPVKFIVGTVNADGNGTYVRQVDDPQSWLASGSIAPEHISADWLERGLVDIAPGNIVDVTIDHAEGASVKLHKASKNDPTFTLGDIPKGREAGPSYMLNGPASMLSTLRFDDVMPAADAPPGDKAVKAHFLGYDGLVIDAVEWKAKDKPLAQFTASVDAAQADKSITAQQAKEKADHEVKVVADKDAAAKGKLTKADKDSAATEAVPLSVTDPVKDHANKRSEIDKKVAELNARFKGWTFVLPAPKYEAMDKTTDDLLKPLEKAAPESKPVHGTKPPAKVAKPPVRGKH